VQAHRECASIDSVIAVRPARNAAFKFEWLGKVFEGTGEEVDVFWAWSWRAVGSTWLEVFSQSPAGDSGWFFV
jgi:hypothetical protein